jgi:hypothetical protein
MADEVEQGGRNIRPTTILGVVVAVLLGVFVFQNTHEVPVELFFWEFSGPLCRRPHRARAGQRAGAGPQALTAVPSATAQS